MKDAKDWWTEIMQRTEPYRTSVTVANQIGVEVIRAAQLDALRAAAKDVCYLCNCQELLDVKDHGSYATWDGKSTIKWSEARPHKDCDMWEHLTQGYPPRTCSASAIHARIAKMKGEQDAER